jgi:hypothetical protein
MSARDPVLNIAAFIIHDPWDLTGIPAIDGLSALHSAIRCHWPHATRPQIVAAYEIALPIIRAEIENEEDRIGPRRRAA